MSRVNSIARPDVDALASRLAASVERGERQLQQLDSSLDGALHDHDTIQEDQDALRALIDSVRTDVLQARRALARIADGTYGTCRSCGTAIAPERLDAIPTTEKCSRCA